MVRSEQGTGPARSDRERRQERPRLRLDHGGTCAEWRRTKTIALLDATAVGEEDAAICMLRT